MKLNLICLYRDMQEKFHYTKISVQNININVI